MSAGVIDFSRWNDMPWWQQRGFKTREAAWEGFGSEQRMFCQGRVSHTQEDVRLINEAAAKARISDGAK